MAKFEKPKGKGGGKDGPGPDGPGPIFEVVEPLCPVCQDERRLRIDYLLAMKTPFTEMARLFPPIPYRSFSNHAKKHLRYEDASVKEILEFEAGLAGENMEAGVRGAFLRRSALDISIKKYFDALTAGTLSVEAGDVIKMIELREKLDASSASTQIAVYEEQFNAFKGAMEEICPPEMLVKILDRTKEKLQTVDRPALQPPDER